MYILLDSGADPNVGNDRGCTALHSAACDDDRYVCQLLISCGADKTSATIDVSHVLFTSMHWFGHATALCTKIDMIV